MVHSEKSKSSLLRKVSLSLFSFILLFLISVHPASAETRTIDELRTSVVRILCYGIDGQIYTGTGFAVGTSDPVRHIVTNYHVVEANLNGVTILLSKEDQIEATVIAFDAVKDIAVLELSQDLFKRPPMELGDSKDVKASQEVYALGYPGDADLIDDTPSGEPDDVSITRGIISKISTQGGRAIYQIDVDINPGNSGGPLINAEGQVIGINTFGVTTASGINGAVQIDELIPILESRGIEYLISTEEVAKEDIVVTTESSNKIWWIIGIVGTGILFLLVVIVLLVVVFRKKGNKFSPVVNQVVAPALASRASVLVQNPVLKGISGYFAGQTMELDQNYFSIGRDARQCQLVFPHHSEEISRKHCTLRFDQSSQTFTIEDSSSNGTYLLSGERIPQGKITQLRSGDRFYLSTQENLFEVRLESR
jgi:S1-C subfamily serine protease